jgi:hypothetical protein
MLYFPSDNAAEVAALEPWRGPLEAPGPALPWGNCRPTPEIDVGLWHFYVDDSKFSRLWNHPEKPLTSRASAMVEPNFSLLDTSPRWEALYWTGRKRALSRFWQSRGLRIFVDLYVPDVHRADNLLGVPAGYPAYATRGHARKVWALEADYATAEEHAAGNPFLLLVYSGGAGAREWCQGKPCAVFLPHIRVAVDTPPGE